MPYKAPDFSSGQYKKQAWSLIILFVFSVIVLIANFGLAYGGFLLVSGTQKNLLMITQFENSLKNMNVKSSSDIFLGSAEEKQEYVSRQMFKLEELNHFYSDGAHVLGSLMGIEASLPEELNVEQLEYSMSKNRMQLTIETEEEALVEVMIGALEETSTFKTVQILKKERSRNGTLTFLLRVEL